MASRGSQPKPILLPGVTEDDGERAAVIPVLVSLPSLCSGCARCGVVVAVEDQYCGWCGLWLGRSQGMGVLYDV